MITKRIIPCFDVKDGRVVKGVQFLNLRDAGNPVELASLYSKEEADELVLLDIAASPEHRDTSVDMVQQVADQLSIPFTVGGGLRTTDDVRLMLESGADKVTINTAAVENPHFIEEAAKRFGSQCIVVAIDAKRTGKDKWQVRTYGGKGGGTPVRLDAVQWASQVVDLGAGEILLTGMDADGGQTGFDVELTRSVSSTVPVPVIASGGAGSPQDMLEAIVEGQADAVLAASIFHFGTYSIREVKEYMAAHGIPVRLESECS